MSQPAPGAPGGTTEAGPGLQLGSGALPLGGVTHVMAVINLSPESANGHTVAPTPERALALARRHRESGATLIDLGAQSSRYDVPTLTPAEEVERLLPALAALVDDGFWVSVDTWKPEVAAAALDAGAVLVNDTGGLQDPRMRQAIAHRRAAAVLMYLEGENPHRVGEISVQDGKAARTARWMEERLATLEAEGITDVVVDPGIAINYPGDYQAYTGLQIQVIRQLGELRRLGRPVLVPIPRKQEDHRVAAYLTLAIEAGADLIRAHDVEWACDLVRLLGREPPR